MHNADYTLLYADATGGLSVAEVSRCLGVRTGDVGALCSASTVSMWAKYKPFRSLLPGFASVDAYEAARRAAFYGMGIPSYDTPLAALEAAKRLGEGVCAWSWAAPRGASQGEPYRLLDFDGYRPGGVPVRELAIHPSARYAIDGAQKVIDATRQQAAYDLSESDLGFTAIGCAWRAAGAGSVNTLDVTAGSTSLPFNTPGRTYEVCFFYYDGELGATRSNGYRLLPYPYFTTAVSSEVGVSTRGFDTSILTNDAGKAIGVVFSPATMSVGAQRSVTGVSFHRRKTWTDLGGGFYQISAVASPDAEDNEADINAREDGYDLLADVYNYYGTGAQRRYSLDCDPYADSGRFFIRFTYEGRQRVMEMGVVLPAQTQHI